MRTGFPNILACALIPLAATLGPAEAADEREESSVRKLAQSVWRHVEEDRRLALRPINADEFGLPDDVAADLTDRLTQALSRTATDPDALVSRQDLMAVLQEVEEFSPNALSTILEDAEADVLMVPRVHVVEGGVTLRASILGLAGERSGRLLGSVGPVTLKLDIERRLRRPPSVAARIAGVALAEDIRQAVNASEAFSSRVRLVGVRSPFGDWFAGQVRAHISKRLAAGPRFVDRQVRDEARAPLLELELETEVWDLKSQVDVQLRVTLDGADHTTTARIDPKTIPARFLPLTRDGGRLGKGFHQIEGRVATGIGLRRDEALFAADAVAWARLIERALDISKSVRSPARTHRDVIKALAYLERAIPHEESWKTSADGRETVRELRARVSRIGGVEAPQIKATLDRNVYTKGVPLKLRTAVHTNRAFVAAYALQANSTIVKISPSNDARAHSIDAGERVDLPGPREAEVHAAPMPGTPISLEAVILVASAVPFNADDLAPSLSSRVAASLRVAVRTSAFLDRLAELDLSRVTVKVLPYRVKP